MQPLEFFKTKMFLKLLIALGVLIVLLVDFQLGMFVGFRKANFAFRWADSYHRNFGGPRGGFLRDFEGKDFVNGHGIVGSIVKIDGATIIIKSRDNIEKTITTSDATTTIKKGLDTAKTSDLKIDDRIVVIGTPKDDGSVEAKMIRIFDQNYRLPERSFMHRFGF